MAFKAMRLVEITLGVNVDGKEKRPEAGVWGRGRLEKGTEKE